MSLHISNTKIIQQQYYGYCITPNLWFGNAVFGLNQFEYQNTTNKEITDTHDIPIRLGKRVEHFVFEDLKQHVDITLLARNLQIQKSKHTIGELDALLLYKQQTIHLEIIFKFYLYDPTVGITELDHWIGPNRNDSLVKKLNKLKNKQLPLLYKPETLPYLENLGLDSNNIEQQVLFKAQLYMPKSIDFVDVSPLNAHCISGTYINKEELPSLSHCQFYLPPKLDWLAQTNQDVKWLCYKNILEPLHSFLNNKQSPLVWIKHPDNTLERCFIVWW